MTTIIQFIASTLVAHENCKRSNNVEWLARHTERLEAVEKLLPHGSGIDNGATIAIDASKRNHIVLVTSFHHMDENGYYDGWTEHTIVVTPSFDGICVDVRGRNRNDIKEYLAYTFRVALEAEYTA